MRNRLLRRGIAAVTALAALVAPAAWPLAALAGHGGRTLLVAVCTTQGVPVQAEIIVPGPSPSDRGTTHACQACVLCAGGADRSPAGPAPAGIAVPACAARDESPMSQPGAVPVPSPVRVARARDPPSLS